jgi:hypothetical protein
VGLKSNSLLSEGRKAQIGSRVNTSTHLLVPNQFFIAIFLAEKK